MIFDFTKVTQIHISVDLFFVQNFTSMNHIIKRSIIDNKYLQFEEEYW